jgi:trehalose 6-phosphate phosphatase
LWLNFDGTLAPIAPEPSEARVDASVRHTLTAISGVNQLTIGVISGRAVEDLQSRIDLARIFYAGNHGLEILGPGLQFVEATALSRVDELQQILKQLICSLWPIPGVRVEDKRVAAAVHYRLVSDFHIPAIRGAVEQAVAPYAAKFQVRPGRKSMEILPRTRWGKEAAVVWINRLHRIPAQSTIYIGGDAMDEDAFQTLTDGVTIKVGLNASTCARYLLSDPQEVQRLLESIEKQFCLYPS